jgi:hypothetical protein
MSRKIKTIGSLLMLILAFSFTSCKDFIEKNIEDETPVIILPGLNDTISANPVHFKWEELDGATKYRLEVVSPSFASIESFVVDSIVTGTNFYIDLDSNQFQFRLTALNAGYTSKTTAIQTFWVGTSQGSSGTTVELIDPLNGIYVNEAFTGEFSWYALPNVSSYTFELHESNSFAGLTIHYADQLGICNINSYDGTELTEGPYTWGVKAYINNGTETVYTKRTFYVDTVNPGLASLVSPANAVSLNPGLITFSWTNPTDQGIVQSPLFATLEVSTNNTFTNLLTPETVTGTSTSMDLVIGTYYWRIKLKDSAGNAGPTPTNYRTMNIVP